MTAKRYFAYLALFSLLTGSAVIGFNYFVDPYAITGSSRVQGFNLYKADINNFTRLSKKYQPLFRTHDTLILGNSRVEMGIDPQHSCFRAENSRVYNMGLPGASVRSQLEYALNIIYQQPIQRVFLSVDFTDFLSPDPHFNPEPVRFEGQSQGELSFLPSGEPNPLSLKVKSADFYRALFSLDALGSSVKTVALQSASSSDRDESGFNPARDFVESVRTEGAGALFSQKLQELNKKYAKPWHLRNTSGLLDPSFKQLGEFLAIAASREVEVLVFTNPFHHSYWELLKRHNLLSLHHDWMASLEAQLTEDPQVAPAALWDFSEDSVYIHESVPGPEELKNALNWFWEPAHYRRELGDKMIDSMLSKRCNTAAVFGRKIL